MTALRVLAAILAVALPLSARSDEPAKQPAVDDSPSPPFRLRAVAPNDTAPQSTSPSTNTDVAPLDDARRQAVLGRLPPLEAPPPRRKLVVIERPAPPKARTVDAPFPASVDVTPPPPARPSVPLTILRRAPVGEVAAADSITINFSAPMVAHGAPPPATPPVIAPAVEGTWRWTGARMLEFRARGTNASAAARFPLASTFRVTVPRTLTSLAGAKLEKAVEWEFATPAPEVVGFAPKSTPATLRPVIVVTLDQRIDAASARASIRVTSPAGEHRTRAATEDELERGLDSPRDRSVGLVVVDPLPPDEVVAVDVGPGLRSVEGPRAAEAQRFTFRTHGTFERSLFVSDGGLDSSVHFEFTNDIEPASVDVTAIRVDPAVENLRARVRDNALDLHADWQPLTAYDVTLPATLRDTSGQTLAAPVTVSFVTSRRRGHHDRGELLTINALLTVLDPHVPPFLPVLPYELDRFAYRVHRVSPADWPAFRRYRRAPRSLGAPLHREIVRVRATLDDYCYVPGDERWRQSLVKVDLAPFFDDGHGHLVVELEVPARGTTDGWTSGQSLWLHRSDLSIEVHADATVAIVRVASFAEGRPLAGVEVSLEPDGPSAVTNADGEARLPLPSTGKQRIVVARRGADVAFLPYSEWFDDGEDDDGYLFGWQRHEVPDELAWHVIDDRSFYRGGERVRAKGWVRIVRVQPDGDVELPGDALESIEYIARAPRPHPRFDFPGAEICRGRAPLTATGGFEIAFDLPADGPLGEYSLELNAVSSSKLDDVTTTHVHRFIVEEERPPRFEVDVSRESRSCIAGSTAELTAVARYFTGEVLPDTEVAWEVRSVPASVRLARWPGFTFGTWVPWWHHDQLELHDASHVHESHRVGRTDIDGVHRLRVDLEPIEPPRPLRLTATARAADGSHGERTAATRLTVFPAAAQIGLRAERPYAYAGEPLRIDAVVTDLDGAPLAGRTMRVATTRIEWELIERERRPKSEDEFYDAEEDDWEIVETDLTTTDVLSGDGPVTIELPREKSGIYRVRVSVEDESGRRAESERTLWLAGPECTPVPDFEDETAEAITDRPQYEAGDVAEVLVLSSFAPAEGTLCLLRSGIVESRRFRMTERSHVLRIPIEPSHAPVVWAHITLSGRAARRSFGVESADATAPMPRRSVVAHTGATLYVSNEPRRLDVSAVPRDDVSTPGGSTIVDLLVRDALDRPVADADAALVIVDDAMLALCEPSWRHDPLASWTAYHAPLATWRATRFSVVDLDPAAIAWRFAPKSYSELPDAPVDRSVRFAAVDLGPEAQHPQLELRRSFDSLALFVPTVRTDANGRASVTVDLPDNLTHYRVGAVAVAGAAQAGHTDARTIIVRPPLRLRSSPPRFVRRGDRFELPVLVENGSPVALDVDVAVRARGLEWIDTTGRRVTVDAGDRAELRFTARVPDVGDVSMARVQIAAVGGELDDTAQTDIPVRPALRSETYAAYGEVARDVVAHDIVVPAGARRDAGGVELTVSPTALTELTDAALYLTSYPYESSEQIASRLLAAVALRRVLPAFGGALPSKDEIRRRIDADIATLVARQRENGAFGLWSERDEAPPFVSVLVADALLRADARGLGVSNDVIARCLAFLNATHRRHIPADYSPLRRAALEAYALAARSRHSDPLDVLDIAGEADRIAWEEGPGKLSIEAAALLLPLLDRTEHDLTVDTLRERLVKCVVESAGVAHVAMRDGDDERLLFHSPARTEALVLTALLAVDADADLAAKLARGLLSRRSGGRWRTTQENSVALVALADYFRAREATHPDATARAWLGDRCVLDGRLVGRDAPTHRAFLPRAAFGEAGGRVVVQHSGAGRAYYRLALEVARVDPMVSELDRGLAVERVFESLDDDRDDVIRLEDGSWNIRAGALVLVRVVLTTPARRQHVALVDPLPAGFEISASERGLGPHARTRWSSWAVHENLRDDRVEAFATRLGAGTVELTYRARATTIGRFLAPPPHAEEMDRPETFGRGRTDVVIVEER